MLAGLVQASRSGRFLTAPARTKVPFRCPCAFRLRRLAQSVGTTWLMPEGLLYRRAMIVFELCKFFVAGVAFGVLRDRRRTSDTFSSAWHFCTLLKRWRVEVRGGFLGRVAQYFVDLSKKVFKTQIKQCFHKMFSFLVRAVFGEIVTSACAPLSSLCVPWTALIVARCSV